MVCRLTLCSSPDCKVVRSECLQVEILSGECRLLPPASPTTSVEEIEISTASIFYTALCRIDNYWMEFPIEIWNLILSKFPLASYHDDQGPLTLVYLSRTCTRLRSISLQSSLWQPHYEYRWLHSDPYSEKARKKHLGSNYSVLYCLRHLLDLRAVRCLDELLGAKEEFERQYNAAIIANELGYDVWDVLHALSCISYPVYLCEPFETQHTSFAYTDAIARKFWAKELKELVCRKIGISRWTALILSPTADQPSLPDFEEAMISVSAVFGEDPFELAKLLDNLWNECRAALQTAGTSWTPEDANQNVIPLAKGICAFMRGAGFDKPAGNQFHALSNHFPHLFLRDNRKTLPMSLVFVFVALAKRFGLQASPVNYPHKVIAHIKAASNSPTDIWVDVYESASSCIVDMRGTLNHIIPPNGTPAIDINALLGPASLSSILIRTAHNIRTSIEIFGAQELSENSKTYDASCYNFACILALFDRRPEFMAAVLEQINGFLLDSKAIFLDTIVPALGDEAGVQISSSKLRIERRILTKQVVHHRQEGVTIKYAVGMLLQHKRLGYFGVIYGWDSACAQGEGWIRAMNVDENLIRGRNQPFYNVAATVGAPRYVAEDNIEVVPATANLARAILKNNPNLGQYFSGLDAFENSGSSLGSFIPLNYMKQQYPADTDYMASIWGQH